MVIDRNVLILACILACVCLSCLMVLRKAMYADYDDDAGILDTFVPTMPAWVDPSAESEDLDTYADAGDDSEDEDAAPYPQIFEAAVGAAAADASF